MQFAIGDSVEVIGEGYAKGHCGEITYINDPRHNPFPIGVDLSGGHTAQFAQDELKLCQKPNGLWYGRLNDLPPNMKKMARSEFWYLFQTAGIGEIKDMKYIEGKGYATIFVDNTKKTGYGFWQVKKNCMAVAPKSFFKFSAKG